MAVIERGSARIWWEARGTGSPLLIIQGIGYPSDASWRLLPGLLTRHTVIAMDNRGVGRSSVPDEQWGIEDMAADAEAVLRAADLGPAHILGLSMGGLVAQELALRSPELVATLMLGCTSPGGPDAILMRPDVAEQFTAVSYTHLDVYKRQRFVGTHFFNPVPVQVLLELVRTGATDAQTLDRARALARLLRKEVVEVTDSPGFATSRLGVALGLEATRMVQELSLIHI